VPCVQLFYLWIGIDDREGIRIIDLLLNKTLTRHLSDEDTGDYCQGDNN